MFLPSGGEKGSSGQWLEKTKENTKEKTKENTKIIFNEKELKKTSLKSYIEEKGLTVDEINKFASGIDNWIQNDDSVLAKKLKNDSQSRKKFIISLIKNNYFLDKYCEQKKYYVMNFSGKTDYKVFLESLYNDFLESLKSIYSGIAFFTIDSDSITDIINSIGKVYFEVYYLSTEVNRETVLKLKKIGQQIPKWVNRIKVLKAIQEANLYDNITGEETLNKEQINFLIKYSTDIFYTNLDIKKYSELDLITKIDLLRYSFGKLPPKEINKLKTKLESKKIDINIINSFVLNSYIGEEGSNDLYEKTEGFLKHINKYNIPTIQLLANIQTLSKEEKKIAINEFLSQLPVNKVNDCIKFLIDNKFIKPEDFSGKQLTVEAVKDELKKERQKFFKVFLGFKKIDENIIKKTFEQTGLNLTDEKKTFEQTGLNLTDKKEILNKFIKNNLKKIRTLLISTDDAPSDILLRFFRERGLFKKLNMNPKDQKKFVFNFIKNILSQDIKNKKVETFLKNDDLINTIRTATIKAYPNESFKYVEQVTYLLSYAIYKVAEKKGVKKIDKKFIKENLENIELELRSAFKIGQDNKEDASKTGLIRNIFSSRNISIISVISNLQFTENISLKTVDKNISKLEEKISRYTKCKSYEEFLQSIQQEKQELKISRVTTKEITEKQAYLLKETNQNIVFQEIEGVYVIQAKIDTKGENSKIIEIKSLDMENANFELAKIMMQNRLNFPIDFSNWLPDDFNKLVDTDFTKKILKPGDFDKIQKFLQVYLVNLYQNNSKVQKMFKNNDFKLTDILHNPQGIFKKLTKLIKDDLQIAGFKYQDNTLKLDTSNVKELIYTSYKWDKILNDVESNNIVQSWLGNWLQKGKKLFNLGNS